MIIRKEHAIALRKLLNEKNNNAPYSEFLEGETPVLLELERAGLVNEEKPLQWVLTYAGEAVATVLSNLYENGATPHIEGKSETDIEVKESHKLSKPEEWPDDFRWIGSEIIAMLDAADRAGSVGAKIHRCTNEACPCSAHLRQNSKERIHSPERSRKKHSGHLQKCTSPPRN